MASSSAADLFGSREPDVASSADALTHRLARSGSRVIRWLPGTQGQLSPASDKPLHRPREAVCQI